MKKIIVLVIMIFVLAFSGCGSNQGGSTSNVNPPTSQSQSNDVQFVELIKSNTHIFATASPFQLVSTAKQACSLVATQGVAAAFDATAQSGVDAADGGFFLGAAVDAYCPQYNTALQDYANSITSQGP